MVASVVDVLAILAIVLFSLRISAGGSDDPTIRTAVSIVIGVASLVHAIALALGATRMFGLRSHRLAMAATVSRSGPAS
jgi:hypothetical protein